MTLFCACIYLHSWQVDFCTAGYCGGWMMQQCCSSTYLAVLCMLLCHKWCVLGYHVLIVVPGALSLTVQYSIYNIVALGIM